jgi:hypothetical protein
MLGTPNPRRASAVEFNAYWSVSASRSFHFNSQFQTGTSNLILKRQPYELSLALAKRLSEASSPFWADGSSALLYVAEVCPGDSKKLRAFRKTLFVRLTQARQRSSER